MAIASVLAIGTTAASSGDITVANGATLAVCLMKTSGGTIPARASVQILRKDSNNAYNLIGKLSAGHPEKLLTEGTYKFTRLANGASVGVFSG